MIKMSLNYHQLFIQFILLLVESIFALFLNDHKFQFNWMNQKRVKQAARGQRQIYEENRSTLFSYFMASICSTLLVASLHFFIFVPTQWGCWVCIGLSAICECSAVGFMFMMTKNFRNERNQVVDAGLDLNDPGAFGEYCKDIIILSVLVQLLGLISAYFYSILLLIPGFAAYKLWINILAPWFFAPAPEVEGDARDKRKQKKREKTVYLKR